METDSQTLPWYKRRIRPVEIWSLIVFAYILINIFSYFDFTRYARGSDELSDMIIESLRATTSFFLMIVMPIAIAVLVAIRRDTFSLWLILSSGFIALIAMIPLGFLGAVLVLYEQDSLVLLAWPILVTVGCCFVFVAGAVSSGVAVRWPLLTRLISICGLIAFAYGAITLGMKVLSR